MLEKKIELLKNQILELESISFTIEGWKGATIVILERIFGENHSSISSIKQIKYSVSDTTALGGFRRDNVDLCRNQGKAVVEACIKELEILGLPDKKEVNNSGINIQLTQNQSLVVSILNSALENELNHEQMQELIELLKSQETKSQKKNKITEKLISFGSDVTSNILANILTNPNIWSQF